MGKIFTVLLVLVASFLVYRYVSLQGVTNETAPVSNTMPAFDNSGQNEMEVVEDGTEEIPSEESTNSDSTSMEVGNPTLVNMEGGMFYFSPNMIKVKKGETVKVTFTNVSGIHDFVLDEFNVKTAMLKKDETAEVTFVADKVGTYEYYCSVGDHRARGMVGTLIVEE